MRADTERAFTPVVVHAVKLGQEDAHTIVGGCVEEALPFAQERRAARGKARNGTNRCDRLTLDDDAFRNDDSARVTRAGLAESDVRIREQAQKARTTKQEPGLHQTPFEPSSHASEIPAVRLDVVCTFRLAPTALEPKRPRPALDLAPRAGSEVSKVIRAKRLPASAEELVTG